MLVPTTSFAKHVLDAYLKWVAENDELEKTYLICAFEGVDAPEWLKDYVMDDGTIIFDLTAHAVRKFKFMADGIEFEADFKGVSCTINVPCGAMVAVYAINSKGAPQTVVNLVDIQSASVIKKEEADVETTTSKPSGLRLVK